MKIRYIIPIILLFVLVFPVGAIEQDFISTSAGKKLYSDLEIVKLRYEPYPVSPGDYFDLWLEVQNTGEVDSEDVVITFVDNYPFFLDESEKPSREFATIKAGGIALVKYRVRVDDRAVEEDAELKVRIKDKDTAASELQSFDISIQTPNPVFFIETDTNPERLKQGSVGELNVKLTNTLTSLMRDINIKLDLTNVPFTPIGSSVERKIGSIASGETGEVTFDLMPSPKTASGVYKIPVDINYYDKSGTLYTKSDLIGVLVDDDAEFQVNLEESDIVMKGQAGKVVVSISNIAESDVKFLSLELLDSDYYNILTNPRVYIGNLEADDYETAEFEIYVKKDSRGKVPLNFLINYKDPFNQAHSNVKIVGLPVYNYFQATNYGLIAKPTSLIKVLLTLLFIFFLFRTYKEWRKQRDIEKAVKITSIKFYQYGKVLAKKSLIYFNEYRNKFKNRMSKKPKN